MEKYPIIQDFAHLCIKMDDEIKTRRREGVTIPDRPKTRFEQFEQRLDAMSDLQKMQIKGLLEHLSN